MKLCVLRPSGDIGNVRAFSYPPFCSLATYADKGELTAQNEPRFLNTVERIRVVMIKV
jgi:hypothetical protein